MFRPVELIKDYHIHLDSTKGMNNIFVKIFTITLNIVS